MCARRRDRRRPRPACGIENPCAGYNAELAAALLAPHPHYFPKPGRHGSTTNPAAEVGRRIKGRLSACSGAETRPHIFPKPTRLSLVTRNRFLNAPIHNESKQSTPSGFEMLDLSNPEGVYETVN
jgi:hypothetical protein